MCRAGSYWVIYDGNTEVGLRSLFVHIISSGTLKPPLGKGWPCGGYPANVVAAVEERVFWSDTRIGSPLAKAAQPGLIIRGITVLHYFVLFSTAALNCPQGPFAHVVEVLRALRANVCQ